MPLSDITTSITGIANRRDLTSNPALVTTFVGQGLRRIERTLRLPSMERLYIEKTGQGEAISSFQAPSDLLQVIDIFAAGRSLVKKGFRELAPMARPWSGEVCNAGPETPFIPNHWGLPNAYARVGGVFYIAPALMGPSEIMMTYYGTLGPLVNPTDDNEITTSCSELLVYGALMYVADYYRLDTGPQWAQTFGQLLQEVQDQADQLNNTGGPSVVASPHGDY